MSRHLAAWMSIAIATACGVGGWMAVGAVEIGANDSLSEVNDALVSVETSLRGSTDVAEATVEALDAAAASVEAAADGSASTAEVAAEVADVAAALPPVLKSVSDGINQVDSALMDINGLLDSLPFAPGARLSTFDPSLTDIDPLLQDLRDTETSLDKLSEDAAAIEAASAELAMSLRTVADELRVSVSDIDDLADDVAEARTTLDGATEDESVDLLAAQLVIAGLALAIGLQALALLSDPDRETDA